MVEDRKSSAHGQNDAIDPVRTSTRTIDISLDGRLRRRPSRTAHIARPNQHGPDIGESAPPVDVAAMDLAGLAGRLSPSS